MLEKIESIELEKPIEGLEKYSEDFFTDRSRDLTVLKKHLQNEDYNAMRKISHNWKGICEPYGFRGLGVLARELEQAAIDANREKCRHLLDVASDYMSRKRHYIF